VTTPSSTPGSTSFCRACGQPLPPGALACPNCGALVHKETLEQLARQATALENSHTNSAIDLWQQALSLLPGDSRQAEIVRARIASLKDGTGPTAHDVPYARTPPPPVLSYRPVESRQQETWQSILLKTGGSMALSILLFYRLFGPWFAVGCVTMILIHEMGHVLANWHYGLRSSPPIFLGFLGAVIYLKDPPPNAKVEAVVGIAGPIAGSVAALAAWMLYQYTGNAEVLKVAGFGFWINLFNLIPVPPLDGGRVAAAITPKLWPAGLAGMIALEAYWWKRRGGPSDLSIFFVLWLLASSLPRITATLRGNYQRSAYFKVPATWKLLLLVLHAGLAAALYLLLSTADRMLGY
jgi:Zn-dependent protease